MNRYLRFCLIGLLIIALAMVRFFEQDLFSDPLLAFFKTEFNQVDAPEFNIIQVLRTTSWRYFLNSAISILIIWIAFPAKKNLLFSLAFFGFAYVVLISLFWYFISDMTSEVHLFIFYIRRFLIQPIFVLILLPAFYYQKKIQHIK
ncbi:exosortase F system-associated membrane protein [Psychroflexus tropicus]|uniref:exosortase F system-associated membrane protein n=1 Tax=Psychroflexus tropicus TaxID=197345 RepID=UPI00036D3D94|nr:exosortase F system-associated protein [Psychroflexus tropicus]